MVNVQLGSISSGGWSDNVGVFCGQNIQNSWDSHSPALSSFGVVMGDYCRASCQSVWLIKNAQMAQPIFDNDIKNNASQFTMA